MQPRNLNSYHEINTKAPK